jgi:Gpi18-like mannosyltransferase
MPGSWGTNSLRMYRLAQSRSWHPMVEKIFHKVGIWPIFPVMLCTYAHIGIYLRIIETRMRLREECGMLMLAGQARSFLYEEESS